VASLTIAAALAAQVHAPAFLRVPLGLLLLGVIPGWLLAQILLRSPGTTAEERAMASLVLSIPLAIAGRTLAFIAGFPAPAFLWGWAVLCAVAGGLVRPQPNASPPADRGAWLVAIALALLVALPTALDPVTRESGDAMFHSQIVSEIRLRGLPPENPSYAGLPMNYVWQLHVWGASLAEATGLTAFQVFPWIGGLMMASLAFGMFRLASLFWGDSLVARLAPAVVALGMNALGWAHMFARLLISPLLRGFRQGMPVFEARISHWFVSPNAVHICRSMIFRSDFVLCSFLYKFLCANAIGTALALIAATWVLVAVRLKEGGGGRLVAIGVVAMGAAAIHPVVGVPASVALLFGLALATLAPGARGRTVAPALAVVAGLAFAVPVLWFMLHTGLSGGPPSRFHIVRPNLPPLAQGLVVVILPALQGWTAVRRRVPELALLGLGFALVSLAVAVAFDTPVPVTAIYPVYTAYFGVALFAAAGVAAWATALARRIGPAWAWMLVALVFLPNALMLFNGFARQAPTWGLAGYPETPDEIALFDYVHGHTPVDAIVIDVQHAYSSSVAAYAERRGFFGGGDRSEAAVLGYPADVLAERRRAVTRLLLEPGFDDTTLAVLRAIRPPLYVIARRTLPRDLIVYPPPAPPIDAVAKLDSLGAPFTPLMRTPSIVVYGFAGARASESDNSRRTDASSVTGRAMPSVLMLSPVSNARSARRPSTFSRRIGNGTRSASSTITPSSTAPIGTLTSRGEAGSPAITVR
jgi:hypothetical protein